VSTDSKGKARVAFELPDNLTRYRIMVLAAAGKNQFGSDEANITARLPLMVRPSPPRFLNFGDRFELPVVLQNQTNKPFKAEVAVRAANASLTAGQGRTITVPANDRVEIRFPAAAKLAGSAHFQVVARSGRFSDAKEFSLPVWTPATSEAFATYGALDKGAMFQPVKVPKNVVSEYGGLEVSTSSTQLQALTDAFVYLVDYPFECTEQVSSRILAIAALKDVLHAFKAGGLPDADELHKVVARDIDKLASLQNWDGGFAFWVRGHDSWPYISIHAAHALAKAKKKGFHVPNNLIDRSKRYLRDIERHMLHYYSKQARHTLEAYALYARKELGDGDFAKGRALFDKAGGTGGLSSDALGWILASLHGDSAAASIRSKILRHLDNKVTETAGAAHWSTSYSDGAHLILHSNRRADGIILDALIQTQPKSDLIPKVVRGLMAHRKKGRWSNTQENAFVLLALDRYFQAYEKVTPNFVAQLWLGDRFAGEQKFAGRSTDRNLLSIPMSFLGAAGTSQRLAISKSGPGRLYYRIGMNYAPKSLKLKPADHGFAVERRYEALDDPKDVVRNADGSWAIKAGARVRVRLTMVAEARRYHVALVDPLPAGLEPLNPALAVTGALPQDQKGAAARGRFWWWMRTWYEHQNMRDERVEAFASLLWAGVHEYSYVARATTPGNFVVPPTRAEEMYAPETFGRSSSDRVVVR
jgi:uncharacterized protein YfaS (alpha-2-macroglobulin family)